MSYAAHIHGGSEHKRYFQTIRRATECALHQTEAGPCDVIIALVEEAEMRELNRRYAGMDEPTDVLSFESGTSDPANGRLILGDVVICLPIAQAQAERADHALEDELALLTVHGVLHLVGYDHATPDDRRRMWERQTAVLRELGHAVGSLPEAR